MVSIFQSLGELIGKLIYPKPSHRYILELSPSADTTITKLSEYFGIPKEEIIRRSIAYYKFLLTQAMEGKEIYVVRSDGSKLQIQLNYPSEAPR